MQGFSFLDSTIKELSSLVEIEQKGIDLRQEYMVIYKVLLKNFQELEKIIKSR